MNEEFNDTYLKGKEFSKEINDVLEGFTMRRVVGYILLSPAIFSVFVFFLEIAGATSDVLGKHLENEWTGWSGNAGGASSALPAYFGLMAIAGVYMVKLEKKN